MSRRKFSKDICDRYAIKYDRKHKNIVFPIRDPSGILRGLVGRTVRKNQGQRYHFYNEIPKTHFFLGGEVLPYLNNSEDVIIVEGPMDWLRVKSFGLKNVVSIMGCRFTKKHVKVLAQQGIQKIVTCMDDDEEGWHATENIFKLFKPYGKCFFMEYPKKGPGDPDEFDKSVFRKAYRHYRPNWDWDEYRKGREKLKEIY